MTQDELELRLLDVVLRHEVRDVGLTVDDFRSGYARQIWRAVLDCYGAEESPSLRRVHQHMLRRGSHRDDGDAGRLMTLPLGHMADLLELTAFVAEDGRLRRIRLQASAA